MHSRIGKVISSATVAVTIITSSLAMATVPTIANLGGNYVNASTVPTGWAYLKSTAPTGGTEVALTPNTTLGGNIGPGNIGFGGGSNFGTAAVLGSVVGTNPFEIFGDGFTNNAVVGTDLVVSPAPAADGKSVIMRYTLTSADVGLGATINIAGNFRANNTSGNGDSVAVYVFKNATQLFTAVGTGAAGLPIASGTFNLSTAAVAGDKISFVVDRQSNYFADETAVRATISVPEPASLAGVVICGAAMLRRKHRTV